MMERTCLVVYNEHSGNWHEDTRQRVVAALSDYTLTYLPVECPLPSLAGWDALAVCGGDGTLHNVLNRAKGCELPLYYFPTGTLNERARIGRECPLVGCINDDYFVYVVAAGSFTPIGYTTAVRDKKRWKTLAYVREALRQYKVHRISASLSVDGRHYEGTYTLIMALKSPRCFLFRFNKMYSADADTIHLLLITAPARDDWRGRAAIFRPLFRAFFVGFRHEVQGRRLVFVQGEHAVLRLPDAVTCNVDGEKQCLTGTYRLQAAPPTPAVRVYPIARHRSAPTKGIPRHHARE